MGSTKRMNYTMMGDAVNLAEYKDQHWDQAIHYFSISLECELKALSRFCRIHISKIDI
jgi:hypothetical protein